MDVGAADTVLHGYFRSSASFRVRIALNLKEVAYKQRSYHLRKGEQRKPDYLQINPQGLVPTLQIDDEMLSQSLAIIEYLDEMIPAPPLLPATPAGRAHVRAIAQSIACDIHPIDNLRVLQYLRNPLRHDEAQVQAWYNHWIKTGFDGLELNLAGSSSTGAFCYGDVPGLADICLVPQVVNAGNYKLDMRPYPVISRIFDACLKLPAFARAMPGVQPDAE